MFYTTRHSALFPAGQLGLTLGCRESDSAAVVMSVRDGGSADKGGVQAGDVVTRIAGRRVGDYDSVLDVMSQVARPVRIEFERETDVEPEERPAPVPPPPPPAPVVQKKKPPPPATPSPRATAAAALAATTRGSSSSYVAAPPTSAPPPPPEVLASPVEAAAAAAPKLKARSGSRDCWLTADEAAESKGNIASRWEKLRQQHVQRQESRLADVRQNNMDELARRTSELELDNVSRKVNFFDRMFADALSAAMVESEAMLERDRDKARLERSRRRDVLEEQKAEDRAARRAPRPNIENVAGHPDQLRIALSEAPRGMKLVYALVDVSRMEDEKRRGVADAKSVAKMSKMATALENRSSSSPRGGLGEEERGGRRRGGSADGIVGAGAATLSRPAGDRLEDLAERTHTWHAYDGPLEIEEAGTYAVLTKVVPIDPQATARFEASAQILEQNEQAPSGFADLASILVDAVRCGLVKKQDAYEILDAAKRGELDVPAETKKWTSAVERRDPSKNAERAEARRLRAQQRAAIIADIKSASLQFEEDAARQAKEEGGEMTATIETDHVIASSGSAVILNKSQARSSSSTKNALVATALEDFSDACAADETVPEYEESKAAPDESQISSAVFELAESPPIMWHEEHEGELRLVDRRQEPTRRCAKCGGTDKLYAHGDFVICRSCALEGAGVLVDPGARRMWFSQMIEFYPSREIPLPKSHPLLAQILRALRSNPGIACRFEGHVNSTCGLDCDGSRPCFSSMCKRVPGGAMGLSTARAQAVKDFIVSCGIEPDRVYAQGFAGTRRLSDALDERNGRINRRVEVHTMLC